MNVIGGSLKGKKLITAKTGHLRPTRQIVKKSLFDSIGNIEGLSFLDLYAGTGSIGIESSSRGAVATMVDCSENAIKIITKNVAICKLADSVKIEQKTAERFLDVCKERFDIVFIDPPYDIPVYKLENIIKKVGEVMKKTEKGLVILEYSKPYKSEFAETVKSRPFGNTVLNFLQFR